MKILIIFNKINIYANLVFAFGYYCFLRFLLFFLCESNIIIYLIFILLILYGQLARQRQVQRLCQTDARSGSRDPQGCHQEDAGGPPAFGADRSQRHESQVLPEPFQQGPHLPT